MNITQNIYVYIKVHVIYIQIEIVEISSGVVINSITMPMKSHDINTLKKELTICESNLEG